MMEKLEKRKIVHSWQRRIEKIEQQTENAFFKQAWLFVFAAARPEREVLSENDPFVLETISVFIIFRLFRHLVCLKASLVKLEKELQLECGRQTRDFFAEMVSSLTVIYAARHRNIY